MTRKKEIEFKASARGIRFRDDLLVDGVDRKIAEIYSVIAQSKFKEGAEWAYSHVLKPADGDDLPEIDREVIALVEENEHYKVVFAHRPPEYWDGKNILTGEVTRHYPKRYDKGNWNQPDVKWWLDIEIPQTNKKKEEV